PLDHPMIRGRIVHLGIFACFLFLICGASRLARFNISVNPQPRNPGRPGRKYFVGMPIPAGAGVIAAVVHFEQGSPIDDARMAILWLCLILFVGFLMVSTWRFWSGKELKVGERHPFRLIIVLVFFGVLIVLWSEQVLLALALGYLVSGVIARLAYSWKSRRARQIPA
ncbi:MAG: CDP-diacylglycerol--serine O-phosphatidyltransferase, partial [Acidobacteriaceae bacterium]|nr:CDP-diacylglycerol--serine O-phosphatidyltransferase [Acidobacteriaceae bacterium]